MGPFWWTLEAFLPCALISARSHMSVVLGLSPQDLVSSSPREQGSSVPTNLGPSAVFLHSHLGFLNQKSIKRFESLFHARLSQDLLQALFNMQVEKGT